jgi:putative oxidoreductase
MRDSGLLGLRLTLGGYLAAHGAQKLFGALDGPGLEATGKGFHHVGLRPGTAMAALAGGSEFVGGLLTAAGLADPVGPVAIVGAMTVATTVHGDKGPMAAKGGYEQALTNLAAALALAATGPGRYSLDALLGRRLPTSLRVLTVAGAAALTAYSASAVVRTRRQRALDVAAPEAGATATASQSESATDRATSVTDRATSIQPEEPASSAVSTSESAADGARAAAAR